MRHCIHIVDILVSSNTFQTNQLNITYCTEVSAILQYITPTTGVTYADKPDKAEGPVANYYFKGTDNYSK